MCGDRSAICLEDDGLGGSGANDLAQPAQVGRAPSGPPSIPEIMAQQQGCEAELGRLESVERLFPRTAQVTHSFVVARWDLDRREVP